MKAKLLILGAIASLALATPTIGKKHVVRTTNGTRAVVTHSGGHWRSYNGGHWRGGYRDSGVSWGVGIGLGTPFYGGYYGGYPGYYGGYPYGYSYYPHGSGYSSGYYTSYPYYGTAYRGYNGSVVARVQAGLARSGYYAGPIDGVIGPRTRYAIRVYERRHGLPADGRIDGRLLATMGLA